jgi:APA family basic amino acid/polyamine antiporter
MAAPPLGWRSLLALGLNGIIGVGIFYAPREVAAALPGYAGVAAYVVVGAMLLPTALVFARLARAYPQDGGPYVYARAAFGPGAAFAVGFTSFVSALFSTATVLVGLSESASDALGWTSTAARLGAQLVLLSAGMLALSRGLRLSAVVWSSVTVLKAVPLLAIPVAAAVMAPTLTRGIVAPSAIGPPWAFLGAAFPVLFALQGFEVVPVPAAQVLRPTRAVPLATIGSLVLAVLLYTALHASCVLALGDVARHASPLTASAAALGGAAFARLVQSAATVSALGISIGMLAMTPRYLAPLGHADAFGGALDRLSARAVPQRAFAVTYVLLVTVLAANARWGSIGNLFALSSLSVTLQYGVTAAALAALALRSAEGLRPRDAWPAPLSLAACACLLMTARRAEVPLVLVVVVLGFGLRAIRRARTRRPGGEDHTSTPPGSVRPIAPRERR